MLAEEELVAVDLSSDGWPAHQLPYLSSLHSSAITTACYVSDCSQAAHQALLKAGQQQRQPASQKVRGDHGTGGLTCALSILK